MRIYSTLPIVLSLLFATLHAEIVEIFNFSSLKEYLSPQTLVILDIDNTLIEPKQTLGSDQWFHYRINYYKDRGISSQEALEKALSEWMSIQSITQMKLCEEDTAETVKDLQTDGYTVMGLTTRGLGLSTRTLEQLKSVGINLLTTAPSHDEHFIRNNHGVLYRGGILFTAGSHKGNALAKLLAKLHYRPSSIIFVNDKHSHIVPVEDYCVNEGIPFTGLRYSFTDEKVAGFNEKIAQMQFEHFGKILSDEEAEEKLAQ